MEDDSSGVIDKLQLLCERRRRLEAALRQIAAGIRMREEEIRELRAKSMRAQDSVAGSKQRLHQAGLKQAIAQRELEALACSLGNRDEDFAREQERTRQANSEIMDLRTRLASLRQAAGAEAARLHATAGARDRARGAARAARGRREFVETVAAREHCVNMSLLEQLPEVYVRDPRAVYRQVENETFGNPNN